MDLQSLILKVLSKNSSEAEYHQLKEWKSESEENLRAFEEIQKIAQEGENLKDHREFNTPKAKARLQNDIRSSALPKWAMLTAVLVLLGVAGYFMSKKSMLPTEIKPNSYNTETEIANIVLPDDSKVDINRESNLTELSNFTKIRNVRLEGEAFFDIARDEEKPFRVHIDEDEYIEVLGTSFHVINKIENKDITVFSGKVAFHYDEKVIELVKGDRLTRVDGAYVKYQKQNQNLTSWRDKKLIFQHSNINTVIKDLALYYDFDYLVSDDLKSAQCKVKTTMRNESLENALHELQKIVGLEYTKEDDTYIFTKCNQK